MKRADVSQFDQARYGSREWVASVLGKSTSWVEKHIGSLQSQGFPKPDPLIGLTYKPDVYEWMERRRKYKPHDSVDVAITPKGGENLERL